MNDEQVITNDSKADILALILTKCFPVLWIIISWFFSYRLFGWYILVIIQYIDFWLTKNIFAENIMGFKYFCRIDNEGESSLFFSRNPDMSSKNDSMFWKVLYTNLAVYMVLLLISVYKLDIGWVFVLLLSSISSFANIRLLYLCEISDTDAEIDTISSFQGHLMSAFSTVVEKDEENNSNGE